MVVATALESVIVISAIVAPLTFPFIVDSTIFELAMGSLFSVTVVLTTMKVRLCMVRAVKILFAMVVG